jgi:MSHA pilin protein MshD
MCTRDTTVPGRRQTGISLIELIISIVIIGIAVTGALAVFNESMRGSVDPMRRKQAIAVAESLLEEIMLQPFTYCDPDDPQGATATASIVNPTTGCSAGMAQATGPTAGELRGDAAAPFDNVIDYSGFNMTGISSIDDVGTVILANYRAEVTITPESVGGVPNEASLRIDVRVISPPVSPTVDVTLTGYRMRYAPN